MSLVAALSLETKTELYQQAAFTLSALEALLTAIEILQPSFGLEGCVPVLAFGIATEG